MDTGKRKFKVRAPKGLWGNNVLDYFLSDHFTKGPSERLERARTNVLFTLASVMSCPLFGWIYWIGGSGQSTLILLLSVFPVTMTLAVQRLTHSPWTAGCWLSMVGFILFGSLSFFTGGIWAPSLIWSVSLPIVGTLFSSRRMGYVWLLLVTLKISLLYYMEGHGILVQQQLTEPGYMIVYFTSILGVAIYTWSVAFTYDYFRLRHLSEIRVAHVNMSQKIEELEKTEASLAMANRSLHSSQKKFKTLVSNIPGVIYQCAADQNLSFEFVSDDIKNLTGYPASDFIHAKERDYFSVVHPEDCHRVKDTIAKAVSSRRPYTIEYRVVHASGKLKWVYEKGQGAFSESGRLLCLEGVIFDITKRRYLGEQLMRSQKMEAIGKITGEIAHDFNNQLVVIEGYSDLLLKKLSEKDPMYQEIVEIKKAANLSSKLTKQLLSFSRRERISLQVINLNELLGKMESMVKGVLGEGIQYEKKLTNELSNVKIDHAQMEQALMNIIMNARDAMPEGGKLTIETKEVHFENSDEARHLLKVQPGDYVMITVKDTGAGMNEEVQAHLFEPFFTTKGPGSGAGLGLATSYAIIEQNNGRIQFHSRVGEGTSFEVYFPKTNEKVGEAEKDKPTQKTTSIQGSETILIVEDEQSVRTLVTLALKQVGYTVLEASLGQRALEVLSEDQEEKIDMMITDVVMPEMGGTELAEKVKALRPDIKVLFMSGYMSDEVVKRGMEGKTDNFLQKPFSPNDLSCKVRNILDKAA